MRYLIGLKTTASWCVEVDAASRDEAEEAAWHLYPPNLCHQEQIEIGDWETDYIEEVNE